MKEIQLFEDTEERLNTLLEVWDDFTLLKKENLIEFYWSSALNEKDILINIFNSGRRTRYATHLDFLYLYAYLALNLYIAHIKEYNALKEGLKEIADLFLKFNKRKYVYNLFNSLGNNKEINILLISWGLKGTYNKDKPKNKLCSFCGNLVPYADYKPHHKNCYYWSIKKKKNLIGSLVQLK